MRALWEKFYKRYYRYFSLKNFFVSIILISVLMFGFLLLTDSFGNPAETFRLKPAPLSFSWIFDWRIFSVFCFLFLLPFLNFKKIFSIRNLDLVMCLSPAFVIFADYITPFALLIVCIPLVYFFMRMLHEVKRKSLVKLNLNLDGRILKIIIIIIIGFSILNIWDDSSLGDSGWVCGSGGYYILEMAKYPYSIDVVWEVSGGGWHSDYEVYPPLSYLVYTPFMILSPYGGVSPSDESFVTSFCYSDFGIINGVKLATIVFLFLAIAGLKLLSNRIGGNKFGTVIVYAWLAHPMVQYNLHWINNDLVPFIFLVWALYFITYPVRSGALLALVTQVKYFSLPLLPLWALMYKGKKMLIFIVTFISVNLIFIVSVILLNGFETLERIFYRMQFFYGGEYNWSIWALNSGLQSVGNILKFLTIPFLIVVFYYFYKSKKKDIHALMSLSVVIIITFILLSTHIGYNYFLWFLGLVIMVILRERKFSIKTG